MRRITLELLVGLFLLVGLAAFSYIAIKLGGASAFGDNFYPLKARFQSIAGLNEGAPVEIAGVRVGKVIKIELDKTDYDAVVHMAIRPEVRVQRDSIASIRSTGLIGDKFVSISPGGFDEYLEPGDVIMETESSVSIEELISKYIFESSSN